MDRRLLVIAVIAVLIAATAATSAPAFARPPAAAGIPAAVLGAVHPQIGDPTWSDFDGNGSADLAIGVPRADVGGHKDAGAVHVLYGSSGGLSASGSQLWTQDSAGIQNVAEAGDRFGSSVASGDFDDDGYGDLAIGIPGEDLTVRGTLVVNKGAVAVLFGSPTGLTARDRFFSFPVPITADPHLFANMDLGWSLAAFDGFGADTFTGTDGRADLAIGMPGIKNDRGGVVTASGQTLTPEDKAPGSHFAVIASATPGDRYGMSLAAGDFNINPIDDVAIGAPLADVPISPSTKVKDAGAIRLMYHNGEVGPPIAENVIQISATAKQGEHFGSALAAADFGGNYHSLLVGVPGEVVGELKAAGVVYFFSAASDGSGIVPTNTFFQQGDGFFGGTSEAGDHFGASVSTGNFGHGAATDIAVGVPGQDVAGHADAGAVSVAYGDFGIASVVLTEASPNVVGAAEASDGFGSRLSAAIYSDLDPGDLAVGVPGENVGSIADAGEVHVFYGSSSFGLNGFNEVWNRNKPGIAGTAHKGDRFGGALH